MFSQELENLIQATLEDGVLEDYEKAALVKRATAEGVDLTELEIYINSLLQKRKRELNQTENAKQALFDQKKKEEFGRVCPNCGKQVPSMTLKCECGYEFSNAKNASSIQELFSKINNIKFTDAEIASCSDVVYNMDSKGHSRDIAKDANGKAVTEIDEDKLEKLRLKKKIDLISTFPVPNTKEDIIEFLSLAAPNSKQKGGWWGSVPGRIKLLSIVAVIAFILGLIFGGRDGAAYGVMAVMCVVAFGSMICTIADQGVIRDNKLATAWRAKFEQVLMKGRSLRGDTEFTQQLDYYDKMLNQK